MKVELTDKEISWLMLGQQELFPSRSAAEGFKELQAKLALARESARQGWRVELTDGRDG